jgi:chorismate mutase
MKHNLNIEPFSNWANVTHQPFIISGPCSAETEGQLLATARLLKET